MNKILNDQMLLDYFISFNDEMIIENWRKINKKMNKFINLNYKKIAFNILKNKYKCRIHENTNGISIQDKKYSCHSSRKSKKYIIAFIRDFKILNSLD